jgi:peptide/nickel transport system permease protein
VGLGLLSILAGAKLLRQAAAATITLLTASPIYWTGTLLIYVFSVGLRALPSAGGGGPAALALPALALGLSAAGGIGRTAAGTLRQIRSADFIRTARAKGLPAYAIALRHMLRAGAAPILTVIGLQAGFLIGGAVVTEKLFVRPGVGGVLLNAINERDYPVVQGVVLFSAAAYVVVNMVTDALAAAADPRLRAGT